MVVQHFSQNEYVKLSKLMIDAISAPMTINNQAVCASLLSFDQNRLDESLKQISEEKKLSFNGIAQSGANDRIVGNMHNT